MNALIQQQHNTFNALHWLHQFGWLRATELGKLMWPNNSSSQQAGSRLAKSLIDRQLVIERSLPNGAGRALVLATGGVRLLAEFGIQSSSGKDLGNEINGHWIPGKNWRHDLIAHGVLVRLHQRGFAIYPEHKIRREAGRSAKIPDGLARKGNQVIWLEVENARKSGPDMHKLAAALCRVSSQKMPALLDLKPTHPMVAYFASSLDDRGHQLDHRSRVTHALQREAMVPINLYWAACTRCGVVGVDTVEFQEETIAPTSGQIAEKPSLQSYARKIRNVLDSNGWNLDDEGCLQANYGDLRALVWDGEHGWCFAVIDTKTNDYLEGATQVDSLEEGKTSAAAWIANYRHEPSQEKQ